MKLIILILLSFALYAQEVIIIPSVNRTSGSGGTPSYASVYYVDATSGNDANNGQSTATAWKTISKVNSASLVIGDTIVFKKGGTWSEQLVPQKSQVIYTSYGSGSAPKLNNRTSIDLSDSTQWTLVDAGKHAWKHTLPNGLYGFGLVELDGQFYKTAYYYNGGTNYPFDSTVFNKNNYNTYPRLDSEYRWYEEQAAVNNNLYVWTPCTSAATYNPANYYSSIYLTMQTNINSTIYIGTGVDSIIIDGLDVESGRTGIRIEDSDYNEIKNCYLLGGKYGVDIINDDTSAHSGSYNLIHGNTITHGQELMADGYYNWYSNDTTSGGTWRTVTTGIRIQNDCAYNRIYNNTIMNFSNAQIQLWNVTVSKSCNRNYFYNNNLLGDSSYLSRAWNITSEKRTSNMAGNVFVNNYVKHQTTDSHFMGDSTIIAFNIFENTELMSPPLYGNSGAGNGGGQIFGIQSAYDAPSFYNNTGISIINNTFYQCEDVGIYVKWGDFRLSTINNLFVNISDSNKAFYDEDEAWNSYDTVKNNLFYYSLRDSSDEMLIYQSLGKTIPNFNTADADGDVISGNYQWTGALSSLLNTSTFGLIGDGIGDGITLNNYQKWKLVEVYNGDVYRRDGTKIIESSDLSQVNTDIGAGAKP